MQIVRILLLVILQQPSMHENTQKYEDYEIDLKMRIYVNNKNF